MLRNLNYQSNKSTLYLIATPIGNLEDITFRALNILKEVDKLYAEDTRVTQKLLAHFDIRKPLISFHEHNSNMKINDVLNDLENGLNVGLVSDAGMPLVSDPGYDLVKVVIENKFNVVSLPGANALLPALTMSGIKTHPFLFYGFLDAKNKKRLEQLEELEYQSATLIFYEAIHRIKDTLKDMYEVFGDRDFVIAREITKAYEEIIKGKLSEYSNIPELKGELVVVIEGYKQIEEKSNLSITQQVDFFLESGMKKTEAMKKVSSLTGIPKNQIYQEYLKEKIDKE
ncbi:16S rRNA (cytidine(1402)-2'-O)-methyltransferase [Candidatus Izemoplasma sp. B36]|uniref:16S rRNA (cytidine(1402)-2'-O)-methyltransferase n=1 Tax=Candidatus Izemoplasma sp. B36 TaxID=3242468 RepID=UPI0035564F88